MKLEKPKLYSGQMEDPVVLDAIIYACKLYFQLAHVILDTQQAMLALLWLEDDTAVWWYTVRATHPVGSLIWSELKALLQQQFRPIDVAHCAHDHWVACVQGRNTVHSYVDSFCRCLLGITNAYPAEVLDQFLCGLAPEVQRQVLVQ